jgi:hypothetical protein
MTDSRTVAQPPGATVPEFFDLLINTLESVHLIHCTRQGGSLQAAVAIVEAGVEDDWQLMQDSSGNELFVRLPAEVVASGTRYKAFSVTFPIQESA